MSELAAPFFALLLLSAAHPAPAIPAAPDAATRELVEVHLGTARKGVAHPAAPEGETLAQRVRADAGAQPPVPFHPAPIDRSPQ